ncbi:hypothetical protein SRHO_G00238350 [Serrasalmus rhombeus]
MAMMLQLIFVLSTLISVTESSDVFGLSGSSVQLDTQHPVPKFDDLTLCVGSSGGSSPDSPAKQRHLQHHSHCRDHDHSINSSCYKEPCEEKEITSPGGVTLSLSVSGSTIICNHSNPVSWKTDVLEMRELKQLCADEGSVSPFAGVSGCLLKTVVCSIILTLMLSAVITVHIRERLTKSS